MIATWSSTFGYVSIRDPIDGSWHDVQVADAPGWALGEARTRKQLYRSGRVGAYRLTSSQMEEIWQEEHLPEPEGIVDPNPLPEDD